LVDDINDDFGAKGAGIMEFALQIFDHWGHLIFCSNTMQDTWDGSARSNL
jgi:hypothetical protein